MVAASRMTPQQRITAECARRGSHALAAGCVKLLHGRHAEVDDDLILALISDTCGFAVPFMDYQGERKLHADYFGRKTGEQFAEYCASKPDNAQHRRAPGAAAAGPRQLSPLTR